MNYKTQKCIKVGNISKDLLNRILLQQKHNVLKAFSKQGKNKLLFLNNIEKLDSNLLFYWLLIKVKTLNYRALLNRSHRIFHKSLIFIIKHFYSPI